jgi:hypothetical protein
MKIHNILHIMGAIGCIGGIVGLYSSGWHVWQWPAVALVWVASSYMHAWSAYKANKEIERIHKDLMHSIDQLSKADLRAWTAEMRLDKANGKIDLAK